MTSPEPGPYVPDVREHGRQPDGGPLYATRRLYMQLLAFTGCSDPEARIAEVRQWGWDAVVYQDASDPWGIALLLMHTDADFFVSVIAPALRASGWATLRPRPEMTLFARSYSIGYEEDLERVLVGRPRERALSPRWPWVVWYPLRRNGAFSKLPKQEKMKILGEHGMIGRAWGDEDLAHDIRLACFGLDRADNDFAVALVGADLAPLSKIVETMRGTVQTSTYIERLGPFFVGKAIFQSPL